MENFYTQDEINEVIGRGHCYVSLLGLKIIDSITITGSSYLEEHFNDVIDLLTSIEGRVKYDYNLESFQQLVALLDSIAGQSSCAIDARYVFVYGNIIKPILSGNSFILLSDTPKTYAGQANKLVAVKSDESGLKFINPTSFDSVNLTGISTAITASPGTSTTQIATTEFVQEALIANFSYFDDTYFSGDGLTDLTPITLKVDNVPTTSSTNLISSGAIYTLEQNNLHLTSGSSQTVTQIPTFTNGINTGISSTSVMGTVGISYAGITTGAIANQLHMTGAGGISFDNTDPTLDMTIGNGSIPQGILFSNANGSGRAKFYYDNTDYNFYLASTDAPYVASRILTTQDLSGLGSISFSSLTGGANTTASMTVAGSASLNVLDTRFSIIDITNTKSAQFDTSLISTGINRTFTFPNSSGTLATLNANQTFTGAFTASSTNINVGTATINSTVNIGSGSTNSGASKNIRIGENGQSGSTTKLIFGNQVFGGTTQVFWNNFSTSGVPVIGIASATEMSVISFTNTGTKYLDDTGAFSTPVGGGSGTVTAISIAPTNGFAGSSSGGATPALTISTSVTGLLKGNGTAISAATAGTDYLTPTGSAASLISFPTLNQNTTGSAATLTTARNIQGVSFNGSANIDIISGTGFVKATGTTLSYDNSSYFVLPSLTSGSILYSNGTTIVQDNSNFFWDATNHRLGINNSSPTTILHIAEASTSTIRGAIFDQYSTDTLSSRFYERKARGTFASPTTIVTGDVIASHIFSAYTNSFTDAAKIVVTSIGTISSGIVPSTMALQTANTAGTLTTGLLIDQAQQLTFGGYSTTGIAHLSSSGVLTSSLLVNADITNATIDLTTKVTGLLAVANGGSGVSTSTGASSIVLRDVNSNIIGNAFLQSFQTIVSSATPIVLTVSSPQYTEITGSTAQTVTLPVASTLVVGQQFTITNASSATTTIQSSGGNTVASLVNGNTAIITCVLASGTGLASWDRMLGSGSFTGSSGSMVLANAPTFTGTTTFSAVTIGGFTQVSTIATSNNTVASNFVATGGNVASSPTTTAALLFGGASTIQCRNTFCGTTSTSLTSGNSYANVLIAQSPITVPNASTSLWLTNMAIAPMGTITLTGTGAATNTATLFVGAAPSIGTNKYTAYFDTGNVNIQQLTASKVVFTDAGKNLTSTGIGTSAQGIAGDGSLYSLNSKPHTIFTPTTGATVTLINNQYNIINPVGTLVSLTITLPSSPANNDCVFIKYTQAITTVTYSGGTVVDGIVSPAAGGLVVLVYDSTNTSWY